MLLVVKKRSKLEQKTIKQMYAVIIVASCFTLFILPAPNIS